jgi:hypothetical protein
MRLSGVLLTLALAACATTGTANTATPGAGARRDPNVISAAELAASPYDNLYDAIRTLRPTMLAPHQGGAAGASLTSNASYVLNVYQDNVKLSGVSALRNIPVNSVREVRYLDSSDATQQFGTGNGLGAIVVTSR